MSVVLVPPQQKDPVGGVVVHRYANGARLVRVEQRGTEDAPRSTATNGSSPTGAPDAAGGVHLAGSPSEVEQGRRAAGDLLGDMASEEGGGAAASSAVRADDLLDRGALLAYVELAGPPDAAMTRALQAAGLHLVTFHPVASYLCRGTPAAFRTARDLPFVTGVVALVPELKPHVDVASEEGPWELLVTVAAEPGEEDRLLGVVTGTDGLVAVPASYERVPGGFRVRVVVEDDRAVADALSRLPFVLSVDEVHDRRVEDEVAGLVLAGELDDAGHPTGRYEDWLATIGYTGSGVTVAVVDDGIDSTHPAFEGRIVDKHPGLASHGTMVAGQVAGNYRLEQDAEGYLYGLGIAPGAELVVQDNSRNLTVLARESVTTTGPSGWPCTVQNNSWGTATKDPMDYGADEALVDALVRNASGSADDPVPLTICFSAGNRGSEGLTRPKAAKNIVVVGNSENYRPDVGGTDADDVDDVFGGETGSSVGNCGDGRVRPDVLAPGQWTASANYGVEPGDERYVSTLVRYGGGTSAASPKIAGACAILTQWWRETWGGTPSPAMLKALLVNGAADTGAGGPIPNMVQGWGRASLGTVLDPGRSREYVDQTVLLRDPGEEHTVDAEVVDAEAPLLVTLAWTDPPGPVGSGTSSVPAVVNRLVLKVVTESGETFWGNEFADGWSVATGEPDADRAGTDNLQNVFLPAGVAGSRCTVSVVAAAVSTDCLTNRPGDPQQDFALVVDNARTTDAGGGAAGGTEETPVLRPVVTPAVRAVATPTLAPSLALGRSRVVAEQLRRRDDPDGGDVVDRPTRRPTRLDRLDVIRYRLPRPLPLPPIVDIPVRESDPPPVDVRSVTVDDTLLLVDRTAGRIHHLLVAPRLVSAAATIRRGPTTLEPEGGSASVTVRCHGTPDPALWASGGTWAQALGAAGLGAGPWQANPLELRTVGGDLLLPTGHLDAPATVTPSVDAGMVTFLLSLSTAGATDWHRAFEEQSVSSLTGTCRVDVQALVRGVDGAAPGTRDETQGATLGALLAGMDLGQVRYVDPRTTVTAKVLVAACASVQQVVVEARVRGGAAAVTEVLDQDGGEVSLAVVSDDLAKEAVDWTATIVFASPAWPPVRLSGSLGGGTWAATVTPGSWVRTLGVFAVLVDGTGHVVPPGEGDVVSAEVRYEAPFLDGGVLTRTFGLGTGGLTQVDYPSPPGAGDTALRLTVQACRGGRLSMVTRTLRPEETMLQVKVAPDASVTTRSNADPTSEEDGPSAVHDLALPVRTAEEPVRPMIWGPAQWPASSTPPSFTVLTGSNPFWAVELTTDPSLVLADSASLRTPQNYWWDGLFRRGDTFVMPQDAWDALGVSGRVYYRVFSSSTDTGWADWAVSTDDAFVASLPVVVVGDGAGPSSGSGGGSGGTSASAEADVAALCGYLGVTREDFAAGQDRYFGRLGELLRFAGVDGADDVGPETFRDLVRAFQRANGLSADGIPGEDTLWELNAPWSDARSLTLVRVPMDTWTPPGVTTHVEDRHGYSAMRVRSDVADAVTALRAELNAHGVLMTTSGASRSLDATVTAGRSATSIHYSGAAFDLATVSGMTRDFPQADATNQLYVVTEDGARWRVWARSSSGQSLTLDAVEWRNGATSTRQVSGMFCDVTQVCAAHGFRPIGPRSSFPGDYLSAEWWHFQNEEVLVPWASQFGAEILALDTVSQATLQAQPAIWANRKRIFQRGRNGWW